MYLFTVITSSNTNTVSDVKALFGDDGEVQASGQAHPASNVQYAVVVVQRDEASLILPLIDKLHSAGKSELSPVVHYDWMEV